MPDSKQARAAQQRAKTRLAVSHGERDAARRRRRVGGLVGLVVIIAIVAIIAVVLGNRDNGSAKPSAHPNDTATSVATPTSTAALASAKGKPCVAVKGPLPKGAPAVPVPVGPPPDKLETKDLKIGTGTEVTKTMQNVSVNYIGVSCSTGKIFDSSYSRNQPFTANMTGGVIDGWLQGIPGMKVGGSRMLVIPPSLGYGASGSPPLIAPDETLVFVVDVKDAK
jgi:peptidylprolyl isomerase